MSTADALPQGSDRSSRTFERLAEPRRRELKVHCYRMLGSLHEAEDAVQESLLRAWRSFPQFDGSGSFRGWLYRIATNTCLDMVARRKRMKHLLPDQRGPATNAMPDGAFAGDVAWLEPFPDGDLDGIADEAPNPEARYSSREATRLAFVAILQQLPPRQRAVLLLCDVLGWSAAECAALLGGSTASVNSALQRARETLGRRYPEGRPQVLAPQDAAQHALLAEYLRAWEGRDLDALASLLKTDAVYTMPPLAEWYAGRDAIRRFFAWAWMSYDGFRLVPTAANGQPAFAAYSRAAANEPWAAHSLQVLALDAGAISTLTLFARPLGPHLFDAFGLPLVLQET